MELRLDYLASVDSILLDSLEEKKNRLILTIRDVEEGGINVIEPGKKKSFLEEAAARGFLVDVEASFAEKNNFDCTGQIVSRHYLKTDPDYATLKEFVEKYSNKSKITKIALRSTSASRIQLVKLLGEYRNLAVMEVDGEQSSRLLFSLLGSRLLYCHLGEKTSPGQISCQEAMEFFRITGNEL